jgi:DNA-binding response OmpR family regulator
MNKKTLLLVDDEQMIVSLLGDFLESKGYDVQRAFDGVEGLKVYQASKPDIAVLDINLPGMNGIELGKKIKKINGGIKIVFISGHVFSDDMIIPNTILLKKPFGFNDLLALL